MNSAGKKTLFYYNPTCEMAIENGTMSYMPPENLKQFEQDIAPLMGFAGSTSDKIICEHQPDVQFISFWKKANKHFPQFISIEESKALSPGSIDQIIPWGWSYALKHHLKHLIPGLSPEMRIPEVSSNEFRQFCSRLTSVRMAKQLFKKQDQLPSIAHHPSIPKILSSTDAVLDYFYNHPQGIILKTLWSSSGRGLCLLRTKREFEQAKPWIKARIKQHQFIIAEPLLNKAQDASFQFMIKHDGTYEALGINYFDTDGSGRFQKEHFGIPSKIQSHLPQDDIWIDEISALLIESMQELNIHDHYQGSVGIDVLFFHDDTGTIRLMPFIEVNLRYNMGLINLNIKKHIHPDSTGDWQITPFKNGEWSDFYHQHMKKHPAIYKDSLLREGFMPLTPRHPESRFAAWGFVKPI
ncbi:MAG: hypothetical protein JEZ14_22775 [Marinilabiliaceae bacterium]|nr:hypothetical protein [Marinilabiliaceae bacterium]